MNNQSVVRYTIAAIASLFLILLYNHVAGNESFVRSAGLVVIIGASFGILLQRSRFCFFCILRDFFEKKDGRPLVGILVALITGSLGYIVIFESWVADPSAGYLPQDAHIGPVGWQLVLGGLAFGWGMVMSGSCISAQLYRLGEGYVLAPFALFGTVIGFLLGFKSWNYFYVASVSQSPVLWLPDIMGYGWALFGQILILVLLIIWLLVKYTPKQKSKPDQDITLSYIGSRIFVKKWPEWIAGIVIGFLGFIAYLRVEPLGVTAEIGRYSRKFGSMTEFIPTRLEGLDGFAGCATVDTTELLSTNGLFILTLVVGSFISALISGRFRPQKNNFFANRESFGWRCIDGLRGHDFVGLHRRKYTFWNFGFCHIRLVIYSSHDFGRLDWIKTETGRLSTRTSVA